MLHPVFRVILQHAETRFQVDALVLRLQAEHHPVKPVLPDRIQKFLHQFVRRAGAIRLFDERLEWNQH